MLKNSPVAPIMTALSPCKCYSFVKTLTLIEGYFGDKMNEWPEPLVTLKQDELDLAMNAFGMTIAFLQEALIDESTVKLGKYRLYNPESAEQLDGFNFLVLDSQALEHLEIVESAKGNVQGSLLEYVDHCKTQFGKR